MTRNQLQYWANQEIKRSNLANERETHRNNVITENEIGRHNVATERETSWHNRVGEREVNRHNLASEKIDRANAVTSGIKNVGSGFKDVVHGISRISGLAPVFGLPNLN